MWGENGVCRSVDDALKRNLSGKRRTELVGWTEWGHLFCFKEKQQGVRREGEDRNRRRWEIKAS